MLKQLDLLNVPLCDKVSVCVTHSRQAALG